MAKPQQVLQITTWARKGLTSKGMCEEVEGLFGEKSCSVWQIHVEYDDGASGFWKRHFDVLSSAGPLMETQVKSCKKRGKKERLLAQKCRGLKTHIWEEQGTEQRERTK